ncbi:alpha/beta fold hydrolase [Nocardioides jensenii]|uniref:alpha/beta fold hydrolase n=1 Tax=Nocardioides jensenii TaxID=1843 RepID=UPI00083611D8|nr:alpha/beta fold hydrolase [Nocardioides jensenii]
MQRVRTFSNAGLTFDVIDEGPIDGPVAVLLHGFPQRASSWNAVASRLHGQGIRTVAPDQRGYSPRARPHRRAAYRMENLVADVETLIRTLDVGPVHLVGHDWGSAVAWTTAVAHPELVRSLTAVSVTHPAAFLRSMVGTQVLRSWYMGFFQLPWLPERVLADPAGARRALGRTGMTREMVETFGSDIVEYGALRGSLNWYRALPFTHPRVLRGRVAAPTTLVWSDGDVAAGRRGVELAERHVAGPFELQVLTGISHWIPDEAPDVLAEIVCERIDAAENKRFVPPGH